MRVARLRAVGFRGIRDLIDLEFPGTFAVITGPNGSGKSTICDAVEFALTGSLAKAYMHVEKNEDILDYLWWRGPEPASDHYVSLTLVRDDGELLTVRRTPNRTKIEPSTDLARELCDPQSAPSNALSQLCLTSIIRDESITQTSIDLNESERFRFVQNAVGATTLAPFAERADEIEQDLKRRLDSIDAEYSVARTRVETLLSQLSIAEAQRVRSGEFAHAENTLRGILNDRTGSADALTSAAREYLTSSRERVATLEEIQRQIVALDAQRAAVDTAEYQQRLRGLEAEVSELTAQREKLTRERTALGHEIAKHEAASPSLTSLAELFSHGRRLGLQEGRCPLCGPGLRRSTFVSISRKSTGT